MPRPAVDAMWGLPRDQAQALNPHTGQVTQPSAWTRGPSQSGQARERGMTMVRMRTRRVMRISSRTYVLMEGMLLEHMYAVKAARGMEGPRRLARS